MPKKDEKLVLASTPTSILRKTQRLRNLAAEVMHDALKGRDHRKRPPPPRRRRSAAEDVLDVLASDDVDDVIGDGGFGGDNNVPRR